MLPVTHGDRFTRLHILLYTMILSAVCLMPLASGMSGTIYLISALALNGVFLAYAIRLYLSYSDRLARPPFAIRSFICLASSRHC
jgi:protoheme IX farnesyltransferase